MRQDNPELNRNSQAAHWQRSARVVLRTAAAANRSPRGRTLICINALRDEKARSIM